MEIEERMAKAEAEIAASKEGQSALQATTERTISELRALRSAMQHAFAEQRAAMEHGFAEQRAALEHGLAGQRAATEHGFAEQRAAMDRGFAEERAARERAFRWVFGVMLSLLAMVLGIIAKLAGAF